jgi:hypothetical protein
MGDPFTFQIRFRPFALRPGTSSIKRKDAEPQRRNDFQADIQNECHKASMRSNLFPGNVPRWQLDRLRKVEHYSCGVPCSAG